MSTSAPLPSPPPPPTTTPLTTLTELVHERLNQHRSSFSGVKGASPPPDAEVEQHQQILVRLIVRCFVDHKQSWTDLEGAAAQITNADHAALSLVCTALYSHVNPYDVGLLQPISNLAFLLTLLKIDPNMIKQW